MKTKIKLCQGVPSAVICLRRDFCPADKLWISICHCERKTGDPAGYCVPAGSPFLTNFQVPPKMSKYTSVKNREFDEIVVFSAGFENSSVRGARFAFEITLLQAIMLTLMLVCAFPPRVHSIPWGPLNKNSKRRELSVFNRVDGFLSGNPKYRYKACEKCRGDAAQKDNSDLANSVT